MILRKPVVEYHLRGYLKAVLWFVSAYMAVYAFVGLISVSQAGDSTASVMGIEFPFALFFMIACMSTFKEENHFFLQLGVSRKAAFTSLITSTLIAGAMAALLSLLLDGIAGRIASFPGVNLERINIFAQFFTPWSQAAGRVPALLAHFLWMLTLYLAMGALGYFFANLFYRLSKLGKILVPVGAGLVGIFSPVLDHLTGGRLLGALARGFIWMFGGGGETVAPINSILVFFLFALVFFTVCWIFMRRFQMKKQGS